MTTTYNPEDGKMCGSCAFWMLHGSNQDPHACNADVPMSVVSKQTMFWHDGKKCKFWKAFFDNEDENYKVEANSMTGALARVEYSIDKLKWKERK